MLCPFGSMVGSLLSKTACFAPFFHSAAQLLPDANRIQSAV
jgi:hypothetical protein